MRKVILTKSVTKFFAALPSKKRTAVFLALDELSTNPFSNTLDIKRLQGQHARRLRIGTIRVIYTVDNHTITITVINA